jgi:uncharacterized protein YhhL (DUF1145 family)
MNALSRAALLSLYALAIAALFVSLPWGAGPVLQNIAKITIAIHVIELLIWFKHVKAYSGPLWSSILLTLLFGLLHWLPIAKRQAS